ncbi:MAG TPA: cell division protein ZapA [Treponemataceae bacterium]|jgi:cell division protein ZapA|nr:cell division protein ZapA [Treponemataceae bacterium]
MSRGTLQIDTLGTSFSVQTDEKPEYLNVLYSHLKKTINEIEQASGIDDPLKIAILAGIQISDELYKERLRLRDQSKNIDLVEAEQLALHMIHKIDQAIQ